MFFRSWKLKYHFAPNEISSMNRVLIQRRKSFVLSRGQNMILWIYNKTTTEPMRSGLSRDEVVGFHFQWPISRFTQSTEREEERDFFIQSWNLWIEIKKFLFLVLSLKMLIEPRTELIFSFHVFAFFLPHRRFVAQLEGTKKTKIRNKCYHLKQHLRE